jgi:hypothetical protein
MFSNQPSTLKATASFISVKPDQPQKRTLAELLSDTKQNLAAMDEEEKC